MKVGLGRHFFDVPPNKGTWRGKAKESIEVAVHSEELGEIPPELAAERVQALAIPIYPSGSAGHREIANQQQEHQQQQEREADIHHQQSQQQQARNDHDQAPMTNKTQMPNSQWRGWSF